MGITARRQAQARAASRGMFWQLLLIAATVPLVVQIFLLTSTQQLFSDTERVPVFVITAVLWAAAGTLFALGWRAIRVSRGGVATWAPVACAGGILACGVGALIVANAWMSGI